MKLYWAPLPPQRAYYLLAGSLLLLGGVIGILHLCGIMICPLKRYTGIPCFTCGSTRAVFELLHGHIANAFRLQPLVSSLLLLLIPLGTLSLYTCLLHKRLLMLSLTPGERNVFVLSLILLALLNWAYLLRSTP